MSRCLALLFTCITFTSPSSAQNAAIEQKKDEAAIRAIAESLVSGWEKANGSAVAGLYSENGLLVLGDGKATRGRAQIATVLSSKFATFLARTRLTLSVRSIQFLTEDVAIMQTEGGILWPGEPSQAARTRGIQSFVVVKDNDTWTIALLQDTVALGGRP